MHEEELDVQALTESIAGIGADPNQSVRENVLTAVKSAARSKTAVKAMQQIIEMGKKVDRTDYEGKRFGKAYQYFAVEIGGAAGNQKELVDNRVDKEAGLKSWNKDTFEQVFTMDSVRIQYATLEIKESTTAEEKLPNAQSYSNVNGDLPTFLANTEVLITRNGTPIAVAQLKDFFTDLKVVPTRYIADEGFMPIETNTFSAKDKIGVSLIFPKQGELVTTNKKHYLHITFKGGQFYDQIK